MKIPRRILIVAFGLLLCVGSLAEVIRQSLPAAVAEGKVAARMWGTGGSSGDAVKLTVVRRAAAGSDELHLYVPPGTRLDASEASAQSMVIAGLVGRLVGNNQIEGADEIVVATPASDVYILETYCANFEKENPSDSTSFSFQGVDRMLGCILREAQNDSLSVEAKQAAVWIETDHITYDHMSQKFPVSSSDWNAAVRVYRRCSSSNN